MEEKHLQMLIETVQSVKSAHHRIDKNEKDIGAIKELTIAVKEIAIETRGTRQDVNDMNDRLKVVEDKPGKNWESVKKTVITRNCNCNFGIYIRKIGIIMEV